MSETQFIRMSLACGYVMGAGLALSDVPLWVVLFVGVSAVGLSAWSIWSNEQ